MKRICLGALAALLPATAGCAAIGKGLIGIGAWMTPGKELLVELNAPSTEEVVFASLEKDVARLVRTRLPDAYWDPALAIARVGDPEAGAGVLWDTALCLDTHPHDVDMQRDCFGEMMTRLGGDVTPDPRFLPPDPRRDPVWRAEMDAVRLQVNLQKVVRGTELLFKTTRMRPVSLATAEERKEVVDGLEAGLAAWAAYAADRNVKRDPERKVSTWVMAGGAANGAFSAGAAWWLLRQLDRCKTAGGCEDDRVDMVGGASTGSLISILTKEFFNKTVNRRQRALDRLVDSYTCSVNSRLYCATDASALDLFVNDAQGLVRFDGIEQMLVEHVDETLWKGGPEYFASTVEVTTGRVLHLSSEDKGDIASVEALRQAVLASIVEPAMAQPVGHVGPRQGTFIDGGIRSGLPLRTPLSRGAERAVIFVNAPLEPLPKAEPPKNAAGILLRSIDLFVHQTILGELHDAEYRSMGEKMEEFHLCLLRLRYEDLQDPVRSRTWSYCEGRFGEDLHPRRAPQPYQMMQQVHVETTPATAPFADVYRRSWIFEPHWVPPWLQAQGVTWDGLAAVGYQFDPESMWKLFQFGAAVAQVRCEDVNEVLGWHLELGSTDGCADEGTLRGALAQLEQEIRARGCFAKEDALEVCEEE